jgi:hypothetical protein
MNEYPGSRKQEIIACLKNNSDLSVDFDKRTGNFAAKKVLLYENYTG